MNMTDVFQNINLLAVIVAALSAFLIGGLWYSPLLFVKGWLSSNKFTPEDLKSGNKLLIFGLTFIFSFIIALNLAMFIGKEGIGFGITAGFLAGFGWVALGFCIIALFEMRPFKYILINGGYLVVSFVVMGAILGAWK